MEYPTFATALAVSVSARNPLGDGVLKVFPFDVSNAAGNTIFFSAAANGGGSDLIVRNCFGCAFEIALMATVQTDYIVDVIGYFMPPEATALQCVFTSYATGMVSASGNSSVSPPFCSPGYTSVATECGLPSGDVAIVAMTTDFCVARNNTATSTSIQARRRCCRVPGR